MVADKQRDPTACELKALAFMRGRVWVTASEVGDACGGTKSGKAQGSRRLGASVLARLIKFGWAESCSHLRDGFPAYHLTFAGNAKLPKEA